MTNKLWSAQELEALTPNERQRVVEEGKVTDLSLLPPSLVARVVRRARRYSVTATKPEPGGLCE